MDAIEELINYADLYGINNGLYIAASIYTVLFAISIIFKKNHRSFGLMFLLASLGYLLLCAFNMHFQSYHFKDVASIYPQIIFIVGKFSPPIIVSIFTFLFISETVFASKEAHEIVDKYKKGFIGLFGLNCLVFLALFFINNQTVSIILSFALFSIYLLLGSAFLTMSVKDSVIAKILSKLFLVIVAFYAISTGLILYDFASLPKWLILIAHFFIGLVTLIFSFIGVRIGYDQLQKFDAVARGQNRELMQHIHNAIKNDEFFMVYQPKLDIHEDRVSGVEALIRWEHPKLGFIRPDQFIPVAESTHLIDSITEWVVEATAKQARAFADAGYYMPISINFSVKNLHPQAVNFLFDTIEKYQLETGALVIEVTETVFMQNNDNEKKALEMLHSRNIPLSLDDYGTGFSSLSSINQLALSEIKIDRGFVSDLAENHEHYIIVRSTLHMSKELGVKVVAEGVEELDMIETLKHMHCDIVQGYGIAKPMRADDMLAWLRDSGYSYIRHQTVPNHEKHTLNL